MATHEDARRIAVSLPEPSEAEDHFGLGVLNKGKPRGFVWAWNVASRAEKQELPAADPAKCVTEPHDGGFPLAGRRLIRSSTASWRRGMPAAAGTAGPGDRDPAGAEGSSAGR